MIVFSGQSRPIVQPNLNQQITQYGFSAVETFENSLLSSPPILADYASSFTVSTQARLTHIYVTIAVDEADFNNWTEQTPIVIQIMKNGQSIGFVGDLFIIFPKSEFTSGRVLTKGTIAAISADTVFPGDRLALRSYFQFTRPDQAVPLRFAVSASVRFVPS